MLTGPGRESSHSAAAVNSAGSEKLVMSPVTRMRSGRCEAMSTRSAASAGLATTIDPMPKNFMIAIFLIGPRGRANGVTELMIPRDIRVVDALPVLGTGKIDYVTLGAMAS